MKNKSITIIVCILVLGIFYSRTVDAAFSDIKDLYYPSYKEVLSGCFGEERVDKRDKAGKIIKDHDHEGIDIPEACGENVYAVATGAVIFAAKNGNAGFEVIIQHNDYDASNSKATTTLYMHLQEFDPKTKEAYANFKKSRKETDPEKKKQLWEAAKVTGGQIIGKSGKTGNSRYPCHLHFGIIENGKVLDPQKYFTYTLRSTTKGCGYPEITEMSTIPEPLKKSGNTVEIEKQKNGTIVYGKVQGDRITKLYLDTYARMNVDSQLVNCNFIRDDSRNGKCQNKQDFSLGKHVVDLKIANYLKQEVASNNLIVKVVPKLDPKSIKALDKLGAELGAYAKENPVIKAIIGAKETGVQLIADMLDGRTKLKTKSAEIILTPTITINNDGTATLEAQTSGLEDGGHTATLETLDVNGTVTDSKQKAFFIDSKPPEVVSVTPASGSHRLAYSMAIKEEGSGIDWEKGKWKVKLTNNTRLVTGDFTSYATHYYTAGGDVLFLSMPPVDSVDNNYAHHTAGKAEYVDDIFKTDSGALLAASKGNRMSLALELQDKAGNTSSKVYEFTYDVGTTDAYQKDNCVWFANHSPTPLWVSGGGFQGVGGPNGARVTLRSFSSLESLSPYIAIEPVATTPDGWG